MKPGPTTSTQAPRVDFAEAELDPDAANPAEQARFGAMLPAQLLQPGELIILLIKPSAWYVLLESLVFLAWVLAIVVVLTMGVRYEMLTFLAVRDVILIGAVVAALRLAWQVLEWLSRVYVLTDRRVLRVKGVVRVEVFECALAKVQHTTTHFSLRERLFGLGTIGFSTAGTGLTEAYWVMLTRPLDIHHTIIQTLKKYR